MTTSMREAVIPTTAIQPNFGPASSLARTPSPSAVHGWPIADVALWGWMSGSDVEARRSEVIDRGYRLSWLLPGASEGSVKGVWTDAGSSALSVEAYFITPTIKLHFDPWKNLYDLDEAHEEERTVPSHPVLLVFGADSSAFPLKAVDFTALAGDLRPDLRDALQDLDEARDEAREERFPAPSDTALGNARRLLHAMYGLLPCRFEVYPTPDGEIAVHSPAGSGRSVLVLCDSDGGALCLVNMNGAHRRARYSDAGSLPDGFVREALAELQRRGEQAG